MAKFYISLLALFICTNFYSQSVFSEDFETGIWWGSEKGLTGKLANQVTHWPEIIGKESVQDNANIVIHKFIK